MLDLSNNNGTVHFHEVFKHGQRRVYLKRSEGTAFVDHTFTPMYASALHAGFKVGAYHFARPSQNSPREEAEFFLRLLPPLHVGTTLRPCLDLEDPNAPPGPHIAKWAEEWLQLVKKGCGYRAIIYGGAYYLEPCQFRHIPTGLWLAAYGRNDGHEHGYVVPAPWSGDTRRVLAHQYASNARVPGCSGHVDISHVLRRRWIDVNRLSRWQRK